MSAKSLLVKFMEVIRKELLGAEVPKKLPGIQVTMADKEALARPMKYPYTFTAKIAQFPWKHYFTNQWIWKYYAISLVVCLPVFNSISKLANSPENVAKWAEIRRKEAGGHH